MPLGKGAVIFSKSDRFANSRRNFTELLAMDKNDKTKAAVKQLRARLMAQVKKLKGLKDRRQALLDENRELTIAIAKKRGETLHVKKPTGFRASGPAPSYSYASRKQRTSVHMDKIMAEKAEEDKAKAKQKARELKAFGGGAAKGVASGPGSPLLAMASPAKKRFTLNRTSSSGVGVGGNGGLVALAAPPLQKRLSLNRTSSSGSSGGGTVLSMSPSISAASRAGSSGGIVASASAYLAATSPAQKRFSLNQMSSWVGAGISGGIVVSTSSDMMAAASPTKKRLSLNRTSSGGNCGVGAGGGIVVDKKRVIGKYFPPQFKGRTGGEEENDDDRKMPHNPDLVPPPVDAPVVAVPPPVNAPKPKRPSLVKIPGVHGEKDEVMSLMPTTEKDLSMLTGMIELKNKINRIAATVLPEGLLEQEKLKSFTELSEQVTAAKDLDELYDEAAAAMLAFSELMRKIVVKFGIDPDAYPLVGGEKIVDHGFTFKSLTVAPLKGRERTVEKIKNECEGNYKCMLDLVRCSIIVETEVQLAGILEIMLKMGIVVRLKNRFANPLPTGIRDCLMNVRMGGHICEVQLHLAPIIFEKGAMHEFYNFFRDLFSGASESYAAIMERVEALGSIGTETGEGEGSVAKGVSDLLKEGDLRRLGGLGDIVGRDNGIGDDSLELVLRRRIVEILEGGGGEDGEGKLSLFDAYHDLGKIYSFINSDEDTCKKYYKLALEGYEELLGPDAEQTLQLTYKMMSADEMSDEEEIEKIGMILKRMKEKLGEDNLVYLETLGELGVTLMDNGKVEEAKEAILMCLAGQEKVLGDDHKDTMGTLNNLGCLYNDELEEYDMALEYYERALKGSEKAMGKNHPYTLMTMMNIAIVYEADGKFKEAVEIYQRTLEGHVSLLGKEHEDTKDCVEKYMDCLEDCDNLNNNEKRIEELRRGYPWLDEPGSSSDEEESEADEEEMMLAKKLLSEQWDASKTLKCNEGHILAEEKVRGDRYCDACGENLRKGSKGLKCKACDFDVCQNCVEKVKSGEMKREVQESDESEWEDLESDEEDAEIHNEKGKRPSLVKISSFRGEEEEVMKLMPTTKTKLIT
ncbi:hypothetical protein TrVE_jg9523 [Triparma verrucosa]|uniref:Phorbol-ester/DAG-type domain-containing protein n=1 Tax=Triparma verrucosa TaxID=1606542 RepID=A0A9W7BJ16_9STRA|nr:hypothetical protein TrVE_jg9523 [Triparma verrucosa]